MPEVAPGSIPGRPWLDQCANETFVEYVDRMRRTCAPWGDEPETGESHPPHRRVAPDDDQIITWLELNPWPFK